MKWFDVFYPMVRDLDAKTNGALRLRRDDDMHYVVRRDHVAVSDCSIEHLASIADRNSIVGLREFHASIIVPIVSMSPCVALQMERQWLKLFFSVHGEYKYDPVLEPGKPLPMSGLYFQTIALEQQVMERISLLRQLELTGNDEGMYFAKLIEFFRDTQRFILVPTYEKNTAIRVQVQFATD